jgi:hypothetical protein
MAKTELHFSVTVKIPKNELDEFIAAFANKDFDFFRYLADNNANFEPQGLTVPLINFQMKREWKGRHRGEFGGD